MAKMVATSLSFTSKDEFEVKARDMNLEFLRGGSVRLDRTLKESDAKHASVGQELREIRQLLEKSDPHRGPKTSTSEYSQSQVSQDRVESKRNSFSIGSRCSNAVAEKVASQNCLLDLPKFDGKNPDCWIVKADLFFGHDEDEPKLDLVFLYLEGDALKWFKRVMRCGGFWDWPDFKCRLLTRFVKETTCSSVEVHLNDESTSPKEAVCETDMVQKMVSEAVAEDSLSFSDCHATEQQIAVMDWVDKTLTAELSSSKELVQELGGEKVAKSLIIEETEEKSGVTECFLRHKSYFRDLVSSMDVNPVTPEDVNETVVRRTVEMPQNWVESSKLVTMDDNCGSCSVMSEERLLMSESWAFTSTSYSAHQIGAHLFSRVPCKKKQQKFARAWKFKYKPWKFQRCWQQGKWKLHSKYLCSKRFQGKQKHERWKTSFSHWSGLFISKQIKPLQFWSRDEQELSVKGHYKCKLSCCNDQVAATTMITSWHWQTSQLNGFLVTVAEDLTGHIAVKLDFEYQKVTIMKKSDMFWLGYNGSLRDDPRSMVQVTHILNFQVKHKWKFKWIMKDRVDQRHILMLLKLREVITCWLFVDVLVWLSSSVRETAILVKQFQKQRAESRLFAECLLQDVFQQFIHSPCGASSKLEDGTLLHNKGYLLQVQLQQKWKKFYKTRRFKYKQFTWNVTVMLMLQTSTQLQNRVAAVLDSLLHIKRPMLPLISLVKAWKETQQVNVHKAFLFGTSGEAGTVHSREYCDDLISNSLRRCCVYLLRSVLCVHQGNKVMHRLQKRNFPQVLVVHIQLRLCFHTRLRASVVSKGGVLIGIIYQSVTWQVLRWMEKDQGKVKTRYGGEALPLVSATARRRTIKRFEEYQLEFMDDYNCKT
ncbi:hypothetical protein Bca101_033944 [Brassica carinata]